MTTNRFNLFLNLTHILLLSFKEILDGSKQTKKERVWNDYKSQTLYIDAMKETMNDDKYDPRRNAHLRSAKIGKFKTDRRGKFVPKNPLTALYLCHAYNVPYATFKRWKSEAFVNQKFVPVNKRKSVILDKKWASYVYNLKRMYVDTQMAIWISKLSTRKYDTEAKKVGE
jgi:hypothetical protein